MTTYFSQNVTCANCHKNSTHHVLGSTNTFGSPDLDLRPPQMKRSTMGAWLQHCPHCGYVSYDLSIRVGDLSIVSGSAYQDVLNDRRFPELARWFLAWALLTATNGPEDTAFARLRAAWVCDDSGQASLAVECRCLAAESFATLKPFEDSEKGITIGAVFVDVLRRAGNFTQAIQECETLLAYRNSVGILRQVLEYQQRLTTLEDTASHTIEECAH